MTELLMFLEEIEPILLIIARLAREYIFLILAIIFLFVVLRIIKRWPDRAKRVFMRAGVHASDNQIESLRAELASIAAESERHILFAATQQQHKIEEIRTERERVRHLVRTSPKLVKEVGQALLAVEKEYKSNLSRAQSDTAREALRVAAEKGMNDIIQSANGQSRGLPPFNLTDNN